MRRDLQMVFKRIAIVGSEAQYWNRLQTLEVIEDIKSIFNQYSYDKDYRDITLVSGGCPRGGVDIWAEMVADFYGIKKDIHLPEVFQWEDRNESDESRINPPVYQKGYKTRNMEIAKSCDILFCFDPKYRTKTGGQWTMRYAQKLGKETYLVLIE